MSRITLTATLILAIGCDVADGTGNAPRQSSQDVPFSDVPGSTALAGALSLRSVATASGRYYGASVSLSELVSSPGFRRAVAEEASVITTMGDLEWVNTERVPGGYWFREADTLIHFAKANGMSVRGHALVWSQALPAWLAGVVNRANGDSIMRRRIEVVMGRYAGRIGSWDVVNEAIEPADGRPDGLRRNLWLENVGSDYVSRAFRIAHRVDPSAQLVYNEYGLEIDTPDGDLRREFTLHLLRDMKRNGVPIDALGIQAHIDPGVSFSADKLRTFLNEVEGLGLTVVVTELDVSDFDLPGDVTWRDAIVAAAYHRALEAFLSHPAVEGVVTWGLSDRFSWLDRNRKRDDGLGFRGLLLDANFRRKPSWAAVRDEFLRNSGTGAAQLRRRR